MSERTEQIRGWLDSRAAADPWLLMSKLLDEIEAQGNLIQDLKATVDSHYQRQDEQTVRLNREIDRLKGIHGA